MDFLMDFWLPILVSAAAVFVVSALAWIALPHHKNDYKPLPNEDATINAIRSLNLSSGVYAFPDCRDHSRMKDPAFQEKMKRGPTGVLHIWPPNAMEKMAGNMVLTFLWFLVVSVFVAYLASETLARGAEFWRVVQITGTAAIMAHCFADMPNAIWFQKPARNIVMNLIDGVAYGLVTAAIFAWLWPSAGA